MIEALPLHDPSFWVLVSFLLFLSVVVRKGIRAFLSFVKEKKETITKQISEVDCLHEEALQILRTEEKRFAETEALLEKEKADTLSLIEEEKKALKIEIAALRKRYKKSQSLRERDSEEQMRQTLEQTFLQDIASSVHKALLEKSHQKEKALFVQKAVESFAN